MDVGMDVGMAWDEVGMVWRQGQKKDEVEWPGVGIYGLG